MRSKKRERVAVTAEKDVLTVVDALTRRGIGERRRAPAKRGPRFENEDARSLFREHGRRRESREAAADDDRVVLASMRASESRRQRANIACAHKRIAITARCGRGTRILRAEDVVAGSLDAAQDLEIDRAHDLGGEKAPAVRRRERRARLSCSRSARARTRTASGC